MGCGCCQTAGSAGPRLFEAAGYASRAGVARRSADGGGGDGPLRRVSRNKTVGEIADYYRATSSAVDRKPGAGWTLVRRAHVQDPRGARRVGGHRRDLAGAVPRRVAAAGVGAEVGMAGAEATPPTGIAPCRARSTSSGTVRERGQRGRGAASCTTISPCPGRARRSFRLPPRTSIRGPKRRSTRGTRIAGRC